MNKRRRDASVSDDDVIEAEKSKRKNKEDLPQIPLPPKAPTETPPKPKTQAFIPPPSVDMELESPKGIYEPSPPQHTNPYQANQRSFKKGPSPTNVHGTTYSVPMEEEGAPKMVVRDVQQPFPTPNVTPVAYPVTYGVQQMPPNPYAQHANMYQSQPQAQTVVQAPAPAPVHIQQPIVAAPPAPAPELAPAPPPSTPGNAAAAQTSFVPRQVSKIEILMPASLPAVPPAPVPAPTSSNAMNGSTHFSLDPVIFPKSHKLFGHLKSFQSALLSTVKYEPPTKSEEDEGLSSLRLSSFGHEDNTEESKALDREDKLARLSDEQMMRFHIKKKQFEAAFRNDCETYSVVTRALLAKDESLQFGLKMSLLENMEDLYKKMMQRVDDLLDQLLVLT